MKNESRRVGARQWKALVAFASADPVPLSFNEVRMVIGMDNTPAHVRGVLSTLETHALITHACADSQHTRLTSCLYRITERGLCAKLGDQGGLRTGNAPLAPPSR